MRDVEACGKEGKVRGIGLAGNVRQSMSEAEEVDPLVRPGQHKTPQYKEQQEQAESTMDVRSGIWRIAADVNVQYSIEFNSTLHRRQDYTFEAPHAPFGYNFWILFGARRGNCVRIIRS